MVDFIPWNSQPLNKWAEKYAEWKFIDLIGSLDIPILIVWGRHDPSVPLERGRDMHPLLKGSRLEIFKDASHSPHDEKSEVFNELAIDFLS